MGADQQFCLRWNNFHTNITSAFESLRDDEDFVDITLACEGRQIKAHKMVLSACSPYFRSLLRGNPCQHPIVFLKDVSFANLTSILDFMYHGEVNVSHNELATFLKTAEALRVRGLAEDEKKREGDMCTESSSPPPPRDPPEPCSPGRPDDPPGEGGGGVRVSSVGDNSGGGGAEISTPTSISEGPPTKRQRRRSGANVTTSITPSSEHDLTNTDPDPLLQQSDTVSRENVKNEPEDYVNEDDDMLGQQQQHQQQQQQHQQIANEDIKLDGFAGSNADDQSEYLSGEGSMSSRSQAAMQQLQDTFSTFIPGMAGQSPGPGFLQPPGSADHGRPHPPFSLEGVQGLPPGISALPGPSMSQAGGASQDASGQGLEWPLPRLSSASASSAFGRKDCHSCPHCSKVYTARCNLSRHIRDQHSVADPHSVVCPVCGKNCRNRSNALTHLYRTHHITSKQLRSEAGVLFNAQTSGERGTNSNSASQVSLNLQALLPRDFEALVQSAANAAEDQDPPTFSFEDGTNPDENGT